QATGRPSRRPTADSRKKNKKCEAGATQSHFTRGTEKRKRANATMTVTKDDEPDIVVNAEPDATMVTAVGVEEVKKTEGGVGGGGSNEPPPAGHSRFYCSKCRAPYDLPDGASTWRCAGCHTFNSTTPGECEWCSIL
ncbi:hypothetical protein ACHAWF_002095, partial [Thalassiosira exigua]